MPDAAVIFDVDGVLLDLTAAEEDAFFWAFAKLHGLEGLSRDWDSYRVRNDEDIIAEILARHFGRKPSRQERIAVITVYLNHLASDLDLKRLTPMAVEGAGELLARLSGRVQLGIATANLRLAAQLRLAACGLWQPLADHAFGADGGGPKREILARAIAGAGFPTSASSSSATISTMSRQGLPMASTSSAFPATRPRAAAWPRPAHSGFAITTGIR